MRFTRAVHFTIAFQVFGLLALPARSDCPAPPRGAVLLSISGRIACLPDAGPLPLDLAALAGLPHHEFVTSTLWTRGSARYSGVLLLDLLLSLCAEGRAVSLWSVTYDHALLSAEDIGPRGPLLATSANGRPLTLRDTGPVWLIYPYDAGEEFRTAGVFARSLQHLARIEVLGPPSAPSNPGIGSAVDQRTQDAGPGKPLVQPVVGGDLGQQCPRPKVQEMRPTAEDARHPP